MPEDDGGVDTSSPGPSAETSPRPAPVVVLASMPPSADGLLEAVRDAARGKYDVLGPVAPSSDAAPVYRAREVSSGRMVALRLARDATRGTGYTLVSTGAAVPLADAASADTPVIVSGGAGPDDAGPDDVGAAGARPMHCPQCGGAYELGAKFCPRDRSVLRRTAPDDVGLKGQVLGERYQIEQLLGRGGMGEVYLARHLTLGKSYAVKVMLRKFTDNPDALRRFEFEAKSAARLSHPNVAAVHDFAETPDGLVYFVMEYVPGESLHDLVGREGPLVPARAARVVAQLGEGLGAVHDMGLLHRDLKPENVVIARNRDGTDLAKIIDFGIVKAVDTSTQAEATGRIGTYVFMSPEQVRGAGQRLDARSDIYALGLVAFYALTGKIPFRGDDAWAIMMRRLSEPPMTLAEAKPEVAWPAAVQSVMDRVLARDPEHRYQSAGAFGSDLATAIADWQRVSRDSEHPLRTLRLIVGVPVRWARDLSSVFRERRRASRPRRRVVFVAAAGGVVLGVGLGAIWATRAWWTARAKPAVAPPTAGTSVIDTLPLPGLRAARPQPALAVTLVANGGSGSVRDGAQLDCGGAGGACSAQYDSGTTVTLTATPGPRSTFAGWGGACARSGTHESCRVRLDEARTVTAGFVRLAVPPPVVVAPEQVLARFRRLTDPARATERDARTALSEVPRLLPQLRTRADTVELRYHEAEAHLRLEHATAACAVLHDVRGRAAGTRFGEPVDAMIAGACSGGG